MSEQHRRTVDEIAGQIRQCLARREKVHIEKRGGHHVVPLPGDSRFSHRPVDISGLNRVLQIDPRARLCVAEPGVTFCELLPRTLEHSLIPTVVPELEGITVGGAVAGCSIEAMSFRHGGFHDSCLEYEIISGDGRVLCCSPEQDSQLFGMIHGSYGTLGILSRVTFRLVPARPYVKMSYRHIASLASFQRALFERCAAREDDFIDGIIHAPDHFVLCLGRFVDTVPHASDYRRLEIYYQSTARLQTDYLSTIDYCFRYDTECHWLTCSFPPLQWRPVRRLLGRHVLGSTQLIRWSNRLAPLLALKRRPDVVCDVFIPGQRFEEFFRWYEKVFDFYPLWVVPYRLPERVYPWIDDGHAARLSAAAADNLVIDCAVYGKPNSDPEVDYSRLLEDKTYGLDGIKTLISRNHYTPQRFWEIYSRPRYLAAKARLDPGGTFPDLQQTFCKVE